MGKQEPKAWHRRSWPSEGEADIDKLYAAVGRAISNWERYETGLAIMFSRFVSPYDSFAARRAYVAVRTFEGRADMLRASSSAYFAAFPNVKLQEEYKMVLSHATSFNPRRNDIAHGVVDAFLDKDTWQRNQWPLEGVFSGYALYPSWASFKERDLKGVPSYCFVSSDIDYYSQHFIDLQEPLKAVSHQLQFIWSQKLALLNK